MFASPSQSDSVHDQCWRRRDRGKRRASVLQGQGQEMQEDAQSQGLGKEPTKTHPHRTRVIAQFLPHITLLPPSRKRLGVLLVTPPRHAGMALFGCAC